MDKRIRSLDGLRGIAILMVISFHAFSRWPELLPYGNKYDFFYSGSLGVELFFLISGFVIIVSLESSGALKTFLFKRWLRLFPAMLVATIIIYTTSSYFIERPMGEPGLLNLLPGVTFIDNAWWSILLGQEINAIEGSFWSLYVEVKFYIFAAVVYFWKGKKFLIKSLLSLFLLSIVIHTLDEMINYRPLHILEQIIDALSFHYFGWFAAGACFYEFYRTKIYKWYFVGILICIISSLVSYGTQLDDKLIIIFLSLVFAYSLISIRLKKILQNRLLLYFGLVSYPLYLLHENMMISIVIKLDALNTGVPSFLLPVIAIFFISIIAYVIFKFIEPMIRNSIKSIGLKVQKQALKRNLISS